ncbi:MAG: ATP-binding protein [Methanosarcina sp.]
MPPNTTKILQVDSNPYISGNPVKANNSSRLFVDRMDIVELIKSNLTYNIYQKPALFLYGRRCVGKSSVLLSLHKLLEKQYIPSCIDFLDPIYGESQPSFCYYLSKVICDSLNERGFSNENPTSVSFQNSPFTILDSWLDKTEELLEKENRLVIICFDEYEKMEECIQNGSLTTAILNQLRNIIQHRKYFVVLISGTNEFSELKINWSDYLINTKLIKIGYLSKDDARTLITNPIDDFTLNYKGGQDGETVNQIINLTNCQPYLTQAVCFELVNYLNSQCRKEACIEDVDLAAQKVLGSANAYFDYIWNIECTDEEKEFLHKMIKNVYGEGNEREIDSLLRKDIIEKVDGVYKFKVELVKMWIKKNSP